MNKNKSLYEAPNTDLLVVRFEQNFCGTNYSVGGIQNFIEDGGDVTDDSTGWI